MTTENTHDLVTLRRWWTQMLEHVKREYSFALISTDDQPFHKKDVEDRFAYMEKSYAQAIALLDDIENAANTENANLVARLKGRIPQAIKDMDWDNWWVLRQLNEAVQAASIKRSAWLREKPRGSWRDLSRRR